MISICTTKHEEITVGLESNKFTIFRTPLSSPNAFTLSVAIAGIMETGPVPPSILECLGSQFSGKIVTSYLTLIILILGSLN